MNQDNFTTTTRKFTHLSQIDRGNLEAYLKQGISITKISKLMNRSRSTIYREIKRGTITKTYYRKEKKVYDPKHAQKNYEQKRVKSKKSYKLNDCINFIEFVEEKILKEKWAPDSCVGYAKKNKIYNKILSTKTIYNYIDKGLISIKPKDLALKLRRTPKKEKIRKYKNNLGKSIELRPTHIENREEFGHWEIDTVIGKKGKEEPVILTLVERKTRYYIPIIIEGKNAKSVNSGLKEILEYFKTDSQKQSEVFKSITADNGLEFASLSDFEEHCQIYFAHPYSSWERGCNEKHNGILRRYLPKGQSFKDLDEESLYRIMDMINNLPRKILGYSTPEELFEQELDKIFALKSVA